MKKIITLLFLISFLTMNAGNNHSIPAAPALGVKISFSSKAYWDGTKCAPREKGCCLHLEFTPVTPGPGQIIGEMSYSANGLQLITSRKQGMSQDTYAELFKNDKFIVDGTGTFSQELLLKLGLKDNWVIPEGEYAYSIQGDKIIITFK